MLLLSLLLGMMLVELSLHALLKLHQDTGEMSTEHFSGGLSFQTQHVC